MQSDIANALLCLILLAAPLSALVGYDCTGEKLNITSLSLTDIEDCHLEDMEPNTEEVYVQLLQLNEYDHTSAFQCRIEIDRTIYYCGMHSHISVVHNGRQEYIRETSASTCKKLIETGAIFLGNSALFSGIKPNTTSSHSITFAGTIGMDGRCKGTQFSDPYGTWDDVVVQATVRISTKTFQVPIKHSSNEVILPSGVRCKATDGECYDTDGTETYWTIVPEDNCHFSHYDALYEGIAHKLTPKSGQQETPTIFTVTTRETTFALAATSDFNLCGYRLTQTEHPKLFVLETQRGHTFRARTKISVDNLDIFSYVNSKFIYVEKHIKTQLTQLYRDIMEQKCALEKQILENALSLSSIAPDEMAFRIMKAPGYTAVVAGEVIYIIKCVPVTCRVRQTEHCYNELPVTHSNSSYFLSPRSRILLRSGTTKDCNGLLPTMFRVDDTWFRMTPRLMEALPPPSIKPLAIPKWKYISPSNMATSGIYSSEDLDRLRNHIMFPVEKPSMLNTIAQGAMGHAIPPGSVSLYNMLDEKSLEKIAENTGERLWQGFITFGSASAGVLTILLLIRLAKLIIDSIIRGYALHAVYGWSLHLLGAIWSSITHLLLHLGTRGTKKDEQSTDLEAQSELQHLPSTNNETDQRTDGVTSERNISNYSELRKYLYNVDDRNSDRRIN